MHFVKESVIPAPVAAVFAFHEREDAFALLQPPFERTEIIRPPTSLAVGTRVELRSKVACFWITIVAEHVAYEPGRSFEDVMVRGPFRHWHHKHLFLDHPEGCLLRDEIEFEPPLGWLGRWVAPWVIRPRLERVFAYRHEVTRREVMV